MDVSTIGWIVTGVIIWILFISFLFGVGRGFKKTLFRFLWLLATGVALFFLTPTITNLLNNIDLSSFNIVFNGMTVTKLSDLGVGLLQNAGLDSSITSSPAIQSFVQNLPTLVLNILLFPLLFWLLKWILWPIWAIISSIIFNKEKREQKKYKKHLAELKRKGVPVEEDTMQPPIKKHKLRLLGGLFGILSGAVICIATFTPFIGINSIFQNVYNSVTIEKDGEEVPYLSTLLDEEILGYVNVYQNSVGQKIFAYSGIEAVSNYVFDNLAVVKVNNENVKLADELKTGVKVYSHVANIMPLVEKLSPSDDTDAPALTSDDIDIAIAEVDAVFEELNGSTIIPLLGNDLLPVFVPQYIDDVDIEVLSADFTTTLKNSIKEKFEGDNPVTISNLKDQIISLLDVVSLLQDNNLLMPIINGELMTDEGVNLGIVNNITNTADFSNRFVNALYSVTLISDLYPELYEAGVQMVFDSLEIEGFTTNKTALEEGALQNSLKALVKNAVEALQYYNDAVNLDFGAKELENTDRTAEQNEEARALKNATVLATLGGAVDAIKGTLSTASYSALLDFGKDYATEMTQEMFDVSTLLDSLDNITNWAGELRTLAPLYQAVIDIKNDTENPFDFGSILTAEKPNAHLVAVGEALDNVLKATTKSKLITSKNLKDIFSKLLDQFATGDIANYLNMVVDKTNNVTLKKQILDNIWTEDQGNPAGGTTKIVSWKNEMTYSLTLLSKVKTTFEALNNDKEALTSDEDTRLADLGTALDNALANANLIVSKPVIKALVANLIVDKDGNPTALASGELGNILFTPKYYDENTTATKNYSPDTNSTIFGKMMNNILNKDITWATELASLKPVFAGGLSSTGDNAALVSAGAMLDKLANSKMLSRDLVNKVVVHYLNEKTTGIPEWVSSAGVITTILNKIKNEEGIVYNYEKEIGNMLNLVDDLTKTHATNPTYPTPEEAKLHAIGTRFNLLLEENASKLIEKSDITNMIQSLLISKVDGATNINSTLRGIIYEKDGDEIVDGTIVANVPDITDYDQELLFLNMLLSDFNTASVVLSDVGEDLDKLIGEGNESKLITRANISSIIGFFFDDMMNAYKDNTDYAEIISGVRTSATANNVASYSALITDLNSLKTSLSTFTAAANYNTTEMIDAGTSIGQELDKVDALTALDGELLAADIANVVFTTIGDLAEGIQTGGRTQIQDLITGFEPQTETYYEELIGTLCNALNQLQHPEP